MVLVIDAGRVVEEGTHAQLLARGGLYSELHRAFVRSRGTAARGEAAEAPAAPST